MMVDHHLHTLHHGIATSLLPCGGKGWVGRRLSVCCVFLSTSVREDLKTDKSGEDEIGIHRQLLRLRGRMLT